MQEFGSTVESVGQKLLPITAAVTTVRSAAIKTTADFESAMSQVAAVSGATGEDLQLLSDKAREMGSKTKFSASETAESMNYMAMADWKTEEMIEGIDGIMNLAAASGDCTTHIHTFYERSDISFYCKRAYGKGDKNTDRQRKMAACVYQEYSDKRNLPWFKATSKDVLYKLSH